MYARLRLASGADCCLQEGIAEPVGEEADVHGASGAPQCSTTATARPMNRAMRRRPGRLHASMRDSCARHAAGCGMKGETDMTAFAAAGISHLQDARRCVAWRMWCVLCVHWRHVAAHGHTVSKLGMHTAGGPSALEALPGRQQGQGQAASGPCRNPSTVRGSAGDACLDEAASRRLETHVWHAQRMHMGEM